MDPRTLDPEAPRSNVNPGFGNPGPESMVRGPSNSGMYSLSSDVSRGAPVAEYGDLRAQLPL